MPESKRAVNPLRTDPTRTSGIRRQFAAAVSRRFSRLRSALTRLVLTEDAFGLRSRTGFGAPGRWASYSRADQLRLFAGWLDGEVRALFFASDWWSTFTARAYLAGARRSFADVRRAALFSPADFAAAEREFLGGLHRLPGANPSPLMTTNAARLKPQVRDVYGRFIGERVKELAVRLEGELKAVTTGTSQNIARALADGMERGDGPAVIARAISRTTDIGKARAVLIARTETIRSFASAQLDALEELGVTEAGVMVEWSVTGDHRMCVLCGQMEGKVFSIKEARNMIPRHPACRCNFTPIMSSERTPAKRKPRGED